MVRDFVISIMLSFIVQPTLFPLNILPRVPATYFHINEGFRLHIFVKYSVTYAIVNSIN